MLSASGFVRVNRVKRSPAFKTSRRRPAQMERVATHASRSSHAAPAGATSRRDDVRSTPPSIRRRQRRRGVPPRSYRASPTRQDAASTLQTRPALNLIFPLNPREACPPACLTLLITIHKTFHSPQTHFGLSATSPKLLALGFQPAAHSS
jgi:hypothetical protein